MSLVKKEGLLAAIIESSENAIISKNLNSIITSWNKSAETMFGYSEQEALGQHIFLIIPDRLREEETVIINTLKEGRSIEHFKTIRVTKEGVEIPISLTISPIRDEHGLVIGASKIARDITKEKKDEETINRYAQSLEIINKVSKKISAKLEFNEILQLVTDSTTQLTGAAFGAFFANKTDQKGDSYMLYTLSGAPREAFEKFGMPRNTKVFAPTFAGEGVIRSKNITKDPRYGHNVPHHGMPAGHLPVVSYLAVPVISQNRTVLGGLFFGHPKEDFFTEEHENILTAVAAQAAIALDNAQLYEDIKALSAQKDDFVSIVSHDLKSPLTVLTGVIQMADEIPETLNENFTLIKKQVTRITAIVKDLLDVSKIRSGQLDISLTAVNLKKTINDSLDSVKINAHTVIKELPDSDIYVLADNNKLIQVFINILSNSVKYSNPGTTITIKLYSLAGNAIVSITDEGEGIAEASLEKIFDRFYRADAIRKETDGLGLGLYISKEIITQHRGKIWAESIPGSGSTFYISLPLG